MSFVAEAAKQFKDDAYGLAPGIKSGFASNEFTKNDPGGFSSLVQGGLPAFTKQQRALGLDPLNYYKPPDPPPPPPAAPPSPYDFAAVGAQQNGDQLRRRQGRGTTILTGRAGAAAPVTATNVLLGR